MEKNNLVIKKANVSDFEKIFTIENTLENRMFSKEVLKDDLQNNNSLYFIAYINNFPVGFISISDLIDTIDLDYIAVLSQYRNKKIGTLLFNHILEYAKKNNIGKIMLEVRESNLNAIKFYEVLGFTKIYQRKKYYKDTGEDAYIYEKLIYNRRAKI